MRFSSIDAYYPIRVPVRVLSTRSQHNALVLIHVRYLLHVSFSLLISLFCRSVPTSANFGTGGHGIFQTFQNLLRAISFGEAKC